MKMKYTVLLAGIAISLAACKNTGKEASDNDAEKVYTFNIDKTKEYIDLKLSDLAENFKLIPLETTEESLIGRSTFYISDQYILAYTQNGVYKFSPEGKFIKKIINTGKGPQEVSVYGRLYFVTNNNLLYINDFQHNEYFLVYDIVAEQFKEPAKKCIPGNWSSLAVDNKGVIMGSSLNPLKSDSLHYALVYQNAAGEFISGIPNTKQQKAFKDGDLEYQPSVILSSEKSFKLYYRNDDTLFSIVENSLKPYFVLEFDKPRDYPPAALTQKGVRRIQFPSADAPGFMIIDVAVTENIRQFNEGRTILIEGNHNYVFLDKFKGTAALIRTFNDDLIGNSQDILKIVEEKTTGVNFPQILPGNKLVVAYNPFDILDAVEKGLTNNGFPQKIVDQLKKISKSLKEEDNPVLLVGELKTNERMKK